MLVLIVAWSSSAFQSTLSRRAGEKMFIVRGSGQGVAPAFWPGLSKILSAWFFIKTLRNKNHCLSKACFCNTEKEYSCWKNFGLFWPYLNGPPALNVGSHCCMIFFCVPVNIEQEGGGENVYCQGKWTGGGPSILAGIVASLQIGGFCIPRTIIHTTGPNFMELLNGRFRA